MTQRRSHAEARARALEAVSRMRSEGLSLSAAARASGTTVGVVKRHAGPALQKAPSGRWSTREIDHLERALRIATDSGVMTAVVRDSRTASRIGNYWNAVHTYLRTGETAALREFARMTVHTPTGSYRLTIDPDTIDRLFDAGELGFDDIYDVLEAA